MLLDKKPRTFFNSHHPYCAAAFLGKKERKGGKEQQTKIEKGNKSEKRRGEKKKE